MTDVANAGIVRPPLIYLCGIIAGVALDLVWPSSLAGSVCKPLGIRICELQGLRAALTLADPAES